MIFFPIGGVADKPLLGDNFKAVTSKIYFGSFLSLLYSSGAYAGFEQLPRFLSILGL
jgi:hypothetical protein